MEVIIDTNGGVFEWMKKINPTIKHTPTKCIGWKDKNMIGAIAILQYDDGCYLHMCSKNPKWVTKTNLTFIAKICYDVLKANRLCCLTSENNYKINKFLDGLGFKRDEIRNISGEEWQLWLMTPDVIKTKKWFKGK